MEFNSNSIEETRKIAHKALNNALRERPIVFALYGELGSGKTTFTRELARGLGIEEAVTSPTFLLMRTLKIPKKEDGFSYLVHIDAYRVEDPKEFLDLGLEEILSKKENIVVIEWPEKLVEQLPLQTIHLYFNVTGKESRTISTNKTLNK